MHCFMQDMEIFVCLAVVARTVSHILFVCLAYLDV